MLLIGRTFVLFLVLHVSESECTSRLSTLLIKALEPMFPIFFLSFFPATSGTRMIMWLDMWLTEHTPSPFFYMIIKETVLRSYINVQERGRLTPDCRELVRRAFASSAFHLYCQIQLMHLTDHIPACLTWTAYKLSM